MPGGGLIGNEANPFAPYRIVRELARGGMGVVYEVEHEETGGRYALKTLLEGVTPDELLRFKREIEVLGALDHPHVVKVHTARLEAKPPFLVQDLLSGGSLAERLRRGPLSNEEAADVVAKLAEGVAAGHALGILHRDLKPENVLFDERGDPRLVDFGLARVTAVEPTRLTLTGAIMGTPAYMAPEQVHDSKGAGTASDVYGLGAVLYAALTARPPFSGNLYAVLEAVVNRSPTPPSAINPDVSPALEAECARAMAKAPGERHSSAQELARALQGCLRGESRGWGRRPGVLLAGLLVAALSVCALVLLVTRDTSSLSPAQIEQRVTSLVDAVERARTAGAYDECPRLRAEVDLLASRGRPSASLRQAARGVTLLEGLGHVLHGERELAAERARTLADSREGSLLLRVLEGTAPDADPAAAVAALRKATRSLGVPEAHLWLARARERQGWDAEVAGQIVRDLDAYAATRPLTADDARLQVRALMVAGDLERAWRAMSKAADMPPELRRRVTLALVSRRLERAEQQLQERRTPIRAEDLPVRTGPTPPTVALFPPEEVKEFEVAREAFARVAEPLRGLEAGVLGEEGEGLARRVLNEGAKEIPSGRRATLAEVEICSQRLQVVRELTNRAWTRAELDPYLKLYTFSAFDASHCDSHLTVAEVLWELGDPATRLELGHMAFTAVVTSLAPEVYRRLEPTLRGAAAMEGEQLWRQRMEYALARSIALVPSPRLDESEAISTRLLAEEQLDGDLRPLVLVLRASGRRAQGRLDESLEDYDRLIELAPKETVLWFLRADALEEAGRTKEAVAEAERFVRSGTYMDTHEFGKAIRLIWRHSREEHLPLLKEAITTVIGRRPAGKSPWRLRRCLLLLLSGRDAKAQTELTRVVQALRRGKQEAQHLAESLKAAQTHLGAGEHEEALEALEAAVDELNAVPGSWE